MAINPTKLTTTELEQAGFYVEKVEQWNSFAKKSKDFLGIIDMIALREGCTAGIQATSYKNHGTRVKKIMKKNPTRALLWLKAGNMLSVWGWQHDAELKKFTRIISEIYLADDGKSLSVRRLD